MKNKPPVSIIPTSFEKILAAGSALLLVVVFVAIAHGHAHWAEVTPIIWAHLLTIVLALTLTPVMLLRPRGTPTHRILGRVWMVAMFSTALLSFFVRVIHSGHFSVIHILSAYVCFAVPRSIWLAHAHRVVEHRRTIQRMVTGALLTAGFFTFPFGRMLGSWLFGA